MAGIMQQVKRAGKHANDKKGLGRKQTPQVRKLRHSSNNSIPYLFPANAIPGLITTVSHRGFPAVEHFSTCTLGPTKITVSLIILFLTERETTRSVCLQIKN